jgi:hypothetical protein
MVFIHNAVEETAKNYPAAILDLAAGKDIS